MLMPSRLYIRRSSLVGTILGACACVVASQSKLLRVFGGQGPSSVYYFPQELFSGVCVQRKSVDSCHKHCGR